MKKDYVIWTLNYTTKSNGPKVLHLLYKELEKRGFNVYLHSAKPYTEGYKYLEKINEGLRKNAIVIYPEVVCGNPLRFQNVVRYVLNYPGKLGGCKTYHSSEIVFTHSNKFFPTAKSLTIPYIDETIFYNDNSKKTQDCYFVYKGEKFRDAKETEGLLEINMDFPKTQKELADLLRKTNILYSYDNCSALLDEATLCGAKVKIITKNGTVDYSFKYDELTENFEQNIVEFIEITQKMDYKGKIEALHPKINIKMIIFAIKFVIFRYILKDKQKSIKYENRLNGF